jgi:hydroxymethylpyrimidine pyrophosphatase-like HAD family hydrolase
MPKHIFFDLDNTLTPSRVEMKSGHAPVFKQLCQKIDVVVVTGGAEEQIRKQIAFRSIGMYYMLSQQGNYAVHTDGSILWREQVTVNQETFVREFALRLTDEFTNTESLKL